MTTALVGIVVVLAMTLIAFRANGRLRSEDRLPMQWLLPDEVVWSAPRLIALAFLPVVAFLTFGGLTVLSMSVRPRQGQEAILLPGICAVGVIFLAIQMLHIWMIERTLRRNGR